MHSSVNAIMGSVHYFVHLIVERVLPSRSPPPATRRLLACLRTICARSTPNWEMNEPEKLIPLHGGYRKLKSFQVAQLAYDVTVRFCDRYIEKRSRTHDQMVQAARSGVLNIAEGSQASGTSKKMELKLTNVARASLEELRLDYEDYLRQRGLAQWPPQHPALVRFKAMRCATLEQVRDWVEQERRQ